MTLTSMPEEQRLNRSTKNYIEKIKERTRRKRQTCGTVAEQDIREVRRNRRGNCFRTYTHLHFRIAPQFTDENPTNPRTLKHHPSYFSFLIKLSLDMLVVSCYKAPILMPASLTLGRYPSSALE